MICAAWALLSLCPPAPAAAAEAPAGPPLGFSHIPAGNVLALAVDRDTAYIGGDFRRVGRHTGGFGVLDPVTGREGGTTAQVEGEVYEVISDGEGGWFIAGNFTKVGGLARQNLAHVLADGSVDADWSPAVNGTVNGLALAGGQVFVCGEFTEAGGAPRAGLAAFSASTGDLLPFDAQIKGRAETLAISPGPTFGPGPILYVGGFFTEAGGAGRINLAGFDVASGSLIAGFAPALDGPVSDLQAVNVGGQFANWVLYAGGGFSNVNGQPRKHLAAFEDDGDLTAFAPVAPGSVTAIRAGGSRMYAASRDSSSSQIRAYDLTTGALVTDFLHYVNGDVHELRIMGSTLYLAGTFGLLDDKTARGGLAALDVTGGESPEWHPDPSDGPAFAMATQGDAIAVGGRFHTVGGIERHGLAAFDLSSGQLTEFNPRIQGSVWTLLLSGSTLYVGGLFDRIGSAGVRRNLAALDKSTGALLPFDAKVVGGGVNAMALGELGLYATGGFTEVGGLMRNSIAAVDPLTGTPTTFAPIANSIPTAVQVRGRTVHLAGNFTTVNGSPREGLAAVLDQPGLVGTVTGFQPAPAGRPRHLLLHGQKAISGIPGGMIARSLEAFDIETGAAVSGFSPGTDPAVTGLTAIGDTLFAGIMNGSTTPVRNLRAFDANSGQPLPWAPNPNDTVTALGASPEGGLVVGGTFTGFENPAVGMFRLARFALLPAAPGRPEAQAGDRAAVVTISAAANGGSPITRYRVTASPGGRVVESAAPGPVTVEGLQNGTAYTFTVTATNAVGTGPPSEPSAPVTPSAGAAADRVAPVITGLRLKPRRFAVAKGRTPRIARARRGTRINFTLSEDARTTLTVQQRKRAGKKVRWRKTVTLVRSRTSRGPNRVKFSGRVGKRRLKPGSYRFSLVATDAAGNRSKPARAGFRVVRR